jgi:hypothetical protein
MNETPWRSLGDSNPCFRRERALNRSIGVHGCFTKPLRVL